MLINYVCRWFHNINMYTLNVLCKIKMKNNNKYYTKVGNTFTFLKYTHLNASIYIYV